MSYRTIPIYVEKVVKAFDFIPVKHERIVDKLDALSQWLTSSQSSNLHPIEKAAIFHAEYIRIHPYVDGNGRTARILSNFILINEEIPTIVLRHNNSEDYFKAVNKAITTHDVDYLIDIFYNAVINTAIKVDKCLDYIEEKKCSNCTKTEKVLV